jgi:hypothetical protein
MSWPAQMRIAIKYCANGKSTFVMTTGDDRL